MNEYPQTYNEYLDLIARPEDFPQLTQPHLPSLEGYRDTPLLFFKYLKTLFVTSLHQVLKHLEKSEVHKDSELKSYISRATKSPVENYEILRVLPPDFFDNFSAYCKQLIGPFDPKAYLTEGSYSLLKKQTGSYSQLILGLIAAYGDILQRPGITSADVLEAKSLLREIVCIAAYNSPSCATVNVNAPFLTDFWADELFTISSGSQGMPLPVILFYICISDGSFLPIYNNFEAKPIGYVFNCGVPFRFSSSFLDQTKDLFPFCLSPEIELTEIPAFSAHLQDANRKTSSFSFYQALLVRSHNSFLEYLLKDQLLRFTSLSQIFNTIPNIQDAVDAEIKRIEEQNGVPVLLEDVLVWR